MALTGSQAETPGQSVARGRIEELDGLRAVAVALVMALHCHLIAVGWVGVQIFFVLSGCVITRVLLRTRPLSTGAYFVRFYRNRGLRILPVYFGYLAALFLLYKLGVYSPIVRLWPYLVTFTQNFIRLSDVFQMHGTTTHLWSLCVEEQFYLVWPWVVLLFDRRTLLRICWGCVLLGPLVRWGLFAFFSTGGASPYAVADAVYWNTLSHADAFCLGSIVAMTAADGAARPASSWERAAFKLSLGACLISGAASMWVLLQEEQALLRVVTSLGFPVNGTHLGQYVWGYTVLNLLFASTMVLLCRSDGLPGFARFLRRPALQRVGEVSYGMYVFHWGILRVIQRMVGDDPMTMLVVYAPFFLLVFGIALLSYRLVERRFLGLRMGLPALGVLEPRASLKGSARAAWPEHRG